MTTSAPSLELLVQRGRMVSSCCRSASITAMAGRGARMPSSRPRTGRGGRCAAGSARAVPARDARTGRGCRRALSSTNTSSQRMSGSVRSRRAISSRMFFDSLKVGTTMDRSMVCAGAGGGAGGDVSAKREIDGRDGHVVSRACERCGRPVELPTTGGAKSGGCAAPATHPERAVRLSDTVTVWRRFSCRKIPTLRVSRRLPRWLVECDLSEFPRKCLTLFHRCHSCASPRRARRLISAR